MEREFLIQASTPEALKTMRQNALTALMQDIGEEFLPAEKEFSLAMIDFFNNIRKNMPELKQLAESLGQLASRGVAKLGEAMDNALPHIQKGIDYLLNNGDEVVSKLKLAAGVFLGMRLVPTGERLLRGAGRLLFGKSGGSSGGGLLGMGGLFGKGGIWDAARTGAAMANSSMTRVNGELITNSGVAGMGQRLYNNIVGGVLGILNRKKLFATGVTNKEAWGNVLGVGGKITGAKTFLPGIAKALGSGATTMAGGAAVGAGSLLGGLLGAAGIGSGILDIIKGTKSTGKDAKDKYFTGGTKIGMVGTGAAAGAAIGSFVPVVGTAAGALIGAGVGGLGALIKGDAIGKALSDSSDHATEFFTQTVPEKWNAMWAAIGTFFTTTLPTWADSTWHNNIVPFFTEDIPNFFTNLWDSVTGFFKSTLPSLASSIWNSIKSFFTESVPNFFSNVWNNITGSAKAGYQATTGVKPHAAGGVFTTPHLGLVAEAGPESIIPLSAGRRSRGLDLWNRTGQMLGVKQVELDDIPAKGSGGSGLTFAPTINIQGNADQSAVEMLESVLAGERERFEAWYEGMRRRELRTSY